MAPAVALLALLTLATALIPAPASALDSDFKHTYAFKVEASNGYSLFAIADSQRLDGRGELVLFVGNKKAAVTYLVPATVTATRIEADLGRLGQVSLDVAPSGKKRQLRTCGTPKTISFEPPTYRGTFEFHGEEGYVEAISSSPRDFSRFFVSLACRGRGSSEISGPGLPGARLGLNSRTGSFRLHLRANKNNPDALRTARLDPPAPFSGHAEFHRNAAPRNRWSRDLTVDLPGRSDVALTGTGVRATLVHACLHEGEGRFRC